MNNTIKSKTECYRKAAEQVMLKYEDGPIKDMLLLSIRQAFEERFLR